jgi:hypothetical protein
MLECCCVNTAARWIVLCLPFVCLSFHRNDILVFMSFFFFFLHFNLTYSFEYPVFWLRPSSLVLWEMSWVQKSSRYAISKPIRPHATWMYVWSYWMLSFFFCFVLSFFRVLNVLLAVGFNPFFCHFFSFFSFHSFLMWHCLTFEATATISCKSPRSQLNSNTSTICSHTKTMLLNCLPTTSLDRCLITTWFTWIWLYVEIQYLMMNYLCSLLRNYTVHKLGFSSIRMSVVSLLLFCQALVSNSQWFWVDDRAEIEEFLSQCMSIEPYLL